MKNLALALTTLLTLSLTAQNHYLTPIVKGGIEKAGSCGSPDGSILEIFSPPLIFDDLEDNGYCHAVIPTTNSVTMCFTFVPSVPNVALNGGYRTSCDTSNFGPFAVYDDNCNFVTSSLIPTGLNVGETYTWCVTMRSWPKEGSCYGFISLCPYWQDATVLPVELVDFVISCNSYTFVTLSEVNNDYFTLEYSTDAVQWSFYKAIKGNGNISTPTLYSALEGFKQGYYRLKQTDFNGKVEILSTRYLDCEKKEKIISGYYNIIGEEVGKGTRGLVIIRYMDGTILKTFNAK